MPEEKRAGAIWIDQVGLDPTLLELDSEQFLHPWRQRAKWLGGRIVDCLAAQHCMVMPFGMFVVPHQSEPNRSSDS